MNSVMIICAVLLASLSLASATNDWGTYFSLPNDQAKISLAFSDAYAAYQADPNKETLCAAGDADFERWYVSSSDKNKYILSYYCRTKEARGYEHLAAKLDAQKMYVSIVEFQTSLKGFGITDAGPYGDASMGEDEASLLQTQYLEKVIDQIGDQKNIYAPTMELCPNPGNQTLYSVQTKTENALNYYKFPISCNISGDATNSAKYMTYIEVAEDPEGKLNGGDAILASIEMPVQNAEFIRKVAELEAAKQSGSMALFAPLLSLLILPLAQMIL